METAQTREIAFVMTAGGGYAVVPGTAAFDDDDHLGRILMFEGSRGERADRGVREWVVRVSEITALGMATIAEMCPANGRRVRVAA